MDILKISDLLNKAKDKIDYEYDFGDSWHHEIILEKILPVDSKTKYPICVDGQLSCPPEDCGGIWGYKDLLEIPDNPEHEEYEEYPEWVCDEFDPEKFVMVLAPGPMTFATQSQGRHAYLHAIKIHVP